MAERPPPTFGAPAPRSRSAVLKENVTAADLAAKYQAMDVERERLRLERERLERTQPPKNIGQQLREQSVLDSGKALTAAATGARTKLPTLADQAQTAFAAAQELVTHPGFEATVGAPNPFKGGFGPIGTFPGSRARDFTSRLDNVKSQAFMQAFESLKGAGAITEKEGEAATKALANLDSSVSEEQFKRNLQAYLDIIKRGYERTKQTANIQPVPYSREMLLAEKARRAALKSGGQ
jgi:uncharacterized membrane protein